MKKFLSVTFGIILCLAIATSAFAKNNNSTELATAIKMYKTGNYSQCYATLNTLLKKDPSNALGYYYLAMTSAQIGKKDEAIANYNKVLSLTSENNNLRLYATKGKTCLETPDKCKTTDDYLELQKVMSGNSVFGDYATRGNYDKLKIENMMREMNRSGDIDTNKFREYRDFSKYKSENTPTDEEIAAAFNTLQKAGLIGGYNNFSPELLMLNNESTDLSEQQAFLNMFGTNSSLSPQVIQALLTNNQNNLLNF